MENDRYLTILKRYWGYLDFRGIQRDIIESIGSGRDTLGLMPTGGGKSITFQVPALAQEGVCIVVTPLIALMKDQVNHLRQRGIRAAALYSGLSHEEIVVTLENCIFGGYKFLYISPERLSSELFLTKLRHIHVSFITVDEAHCISQWGYDFRPSYTRIADIRRLLPDVPVLALTATATPAVVDDIQQQLAFREGKGVFRMSFERRNLVYVVRTTEDKLSELFHILNSVPGTAIVYTRSRKRTQELTRELVSRGISALYYHAGLSPAEKDRRQEEWQQGRTRVMVATNAFGMGIDKADVRVVVHVDVPDAPEAYFQEAGRAGRDGQRAYAVLLYHKGDRAKLLRRVPDTFPDISFIRTVYEHLCFYFQLAVGDGLNVTYDFSLEEFCRCFKHFPVPVNNALHLLARAGYLEYTEEPDNSSRLMFTVHRDELYRLHETPPALEDLLRSVLRNYGGVFSDYVYIDESLLSRQTGQDAQQVYQNLLALTRQRILHYIPRRQMPSVTFLCKRVDTERVVLPATVYDERKTAYTERIEAMLHYAEADECRATLLLRYFGCDDGKPCGRCDVCRSPYAGELRRSTYEDIRRQLLQQTATRYVAIDRLHVDGHPRELIRKVLHLLVQEEELLLREGTVGRPDTPVS